MVRDSASSSRANSFHFGGEDDVDEEVLSFIFMGLVNSMSEKRVDEEGERMGR